jgi:hypothetical protein
VTRGPCPPLGNWISFHYVAFFLGMNYSRLHINIPRLRHTFHNFCWLHAVCREFTWFVQSLAHPTDKLNSPLGPDPSGL